MNYNKKTILDVDVAGRKILLRCDFNVPQDKETGAITSDKRIVAALPTIRYLLEKKAAVIACSHLGKPKGEWKAKLSLAPVAQRLSELLGQEVIFARDIVGEDAKAKAAALQGGQIMLLENLRFDPREEKNDPSFAKELASMAELYVSDAFGTVHRAHASTAGVAAYLPAVSGLLVAKELEVMGGALNDPKRPFVAVLGGAKVSDKIGVINNLLDKADTIIIGGGMAYTFAKAQGGSIGKSLCEDDKLDYALEMIEKAKKNGVKLLLPEPISFAAAHAVQQHEHVVRLRGVVPIGEIDEHPLIIGECAGALALADVVVRQVFDRLYRAGAAGALKEGRRHARVEKSGRPAAHRAAGREIRVPDGHAAGKAETGIVVVLGVRAGCATRDAYAVLPAGMRAAGLRGRYILIGGTNGEKAKTAEREHEREGAAEHSHLYCTGGRYASKITVSHLASSLRSCAVQVTRIAPSSSASFTQ